jgi:hypothetical protein
VTLAFIIAVQTACFFFVASLYRATVRSIFQALFAGLAAGLLIGIAFDVFIGALANVFTYRFRPTFLFLVLNGSCSYGVAFATVMLIPKRRAHANKFLSPRFGILVAAAAFLFSIGTMFLGLDRLVQVMILGIAVLSAGEGVAAAARRSGPVLEAFQGDPSSFIRLWVSSVCLGTVYEMANFLWPVWEWEPARYIAMEIWWPLLICFGYFVLFHPMWVVSAVLNERLNLE